MIERRDIGSWLSGPPRHDERGAGLGLPDQGPGSVARVGRRLVAITLDWFGCLLISRAFFNADPWATLAVFSVWQVLTVGTLGSSPGHRVLGMRVQRLDGGLPGPGRAVVRTVLLSLAIPALIYDRDGRGLHDRAAGTVLVRT